MVETAQPCLAYQSEELTAAVGSPEVDSVEENDRLLYIRRVAN